MKTETVFLQREYLVGMSFTTHSSRKYRYTIKSEENKTLNGRVFFGETYTERDVDGFYGKGKTTYYINNQSKQYKSLKWLLKSMH